MASQHPVDAMARDRMTKSVAEGWLIDRAALGQREQLVDGRRPEPTTAHLAAPTAELHVVDLVGTPIQIF